MTASAPSTASKGSWLRLSRAPWAFAQATIVGEGARCGDVSCQICKKGLTCAYDADSEAQICESNEDGPVTGDPDLSQVPDLAGEKPDLGPPDADLPDADRPDAGEADLRGVGLE